MLLERLLTAATDAKKKGVKFKRGSLLGLKVKNGVFALTDQAKSEGVSFTAALLAFEMRKVHRFKDLKKDKSEKVAVQMAAFEAISSMLNQYSPDGPISDEVAFQFLLSIDGFGTVCDSHTDLQEVADVIAHTVYA